MIRLPFIRAAKLTNELWAATNNLRRRQWFGHTYVLSIPSGINRRVVFSFGYERRRRPNDPVEKINSRNPNAPKLRLITNP